jgi:hypothetical protein
MKDLTKADIEYIKGEKRIGYVFSFIVLFAGCLFDLPYYLIYGIDYIFLIINCLVLILSFFTLYSMNRKLNLDLKNGTKIIKAGKIQNKEYTKNYEAGSGNLYIPIIGYLFPKSWGSHPKLSYICYLTVDNIRYQTNKETYDRVEKEDVVEMYYTSHSQILIGFGEKITEK